LKTCSSCDCQIPDMARACPHCRSRQRRGDRLPQTVLGLSAAAATALVVLENCPALVASTPDPGVAIAATAEASAEIGIARLRYDGGGDWYANPSSLPNLLREIRDRTGIAVLERPDEVALADPDLADHPYLYATGHGNISFSPGELDRLRDYLANGGFLHVDDNYGLDESFRREVSRLFPDRDLAEVPFDHPIYNIFYEFPEGLPKIHEHDGEAAEGLGIFIDGRLALFYSFQSDLGDGWEDEAVHGDGQEVREQAIQMGVNLFLYALASTADR